MLELRPVCEHCNKSLPPSSTEARICSFECTFCAHCAKAVLDNTCPNCGGGLCARPIRPAQDWNNGFYLGRFPAVSEPKHRPADLKAHAELRARIGNRADYER